MPSSPPRSILLADCDVYYVQLARIADPERAGKAELLIVGGSAESRGVVCSATYEVRKYGVRSGMPISRAVRLCPLALCVPVPRKLCSEKSEEIVHVLQRFAPDVESASPDEAYLDLFGKPGEFQNELKVYGRQGLPCRRCRTPIETVKVSGRSAYFCPQCQS